MTEDIHVKFSCPMIIDSIIEWVVEDFVNKICFSGQLHFKLNSLMNKQNCCIWGLENSTVKTSNRKDHQCHCLKCVKFW